VASVREKDVWYVIKNQKPERLAKIFTIKRGQVVSVREKDVWYVIKNQSDWQKP
jgi:hypothetical protein